MRGWFDAFRHDGGPTMYAYSNRTSVTGDIPTIVLCLVFLTIYVAFVIIFPGVRREKLSTFLTVTLSILTGTTICICSFGSEWEFSSGEINTYYRAFSAQRIKANLGVSIGLDHANVTYKIIPTDNRSLDIDFNERFYWQQPDDMKKYYKKGLQKGLPFPVLTAAEYFTLDKEGFSWGRHYRQAGYYTNIILWAAFTTWILANVLLLSVPRYGAYMLFVTGVLMGCSCLSFWFLKPLIPLQLRFEENTLTFRTGWCFWMVLIIGSITGAYGLIVSILDWIYPHKFSTILEVDFDTPFDRHIIIEDSHNTRQTRFKIPKLEEPLNAGFSAGSRLLRRLSRRGKSISEMCVDPNPGVDNPVFEMENTKLANFKPGVKRTDSKKSNKSAHFRSSQTSSNGFLEIPDLPNTEDKPKVFQRSDSKTSNSSSTSSKHTVGDADSGPSSDSTTMKRQDSCNSSASSSSSFGIGMLSRGSSIRKQSDESIHRPVTRNNSVNIIVFNRTNSRGQLTKTGEGVDIETEDPTDKW